MTDLNFKHTIISSVAVYVLGILAYVGSFLVQAMDDPDLQANLVLMVAIIPAAYFGAHLYYRRGHKTGGFFLGFAMFAGAILLDSLITVPVFITPNGGDHLSFFSDPGFWLIGVEYVVVVAAYWRLKVAKDQFNQAA